MKPKLAVDNTVARGEHLSPELSHDDLAVLGRVLAGNWIPGDLRRLREAIESGSVRLKPAHKVLLTPHFVADGAAEFAAQYLDANETAECLWRGYDG
jgi:hypothetical protein